MSERLKKNIKELNRSIKNNAPRIDRRLSQTGAKPDQSAVVSAGKYYHALEKLSKE